MQNLLIVFGSTTGNTKEVAEAIAAKLTEKTEVKVTVKDVNDFNVEQLTDYNEVLLGSSTWGDGELQDDMISFHESMKKVNLAGIKAAAFGTGETSWPQFCKAVDILEDQLKECAATVEESLKIDVTEGDYTADVVNWIDKLIVNWG